MPGLASNKGFTLIEALVAIAILSIAIIGLVTTQTYFAQQTSNRSLQDCLIDAAASGVAQCQGGVTPASTTCTDRAGRAIAVTYTTGASCSPASNSCNDIAVTATAQSNSFTLNTKICNFQ